MRVKINNFSGGIRLDKDLVKLNQAKVLQNFSVADGALSSEDGLAVFGTAEYLASSVKTLLESKNLLGGRVFHFKKFDFDSNSRADKILVFDSEFNGYYLGEEEGELALLPLGVKFSSAPIAINYRLKDEDVIILVSKTDPMVVWDGVNAVEVVLDAPKIESMDLHYERLFAVTGGSDGTELKFSDDLDPTNWSESLADAGFISMADNRGKLLKVVSFNDYLYVFREQGITRVYANTALTSSFYVNHLYVSGGRILGETVALVGGQVMFLATDGFYIFDGSDVRKCLDNIFPGVVLTGKECATYFNGCYYLACKFDFKDGVTETGNNAIIKVRMSDMSVEILRCGKIEWLEVMHTEKEAILTILNSSSSFPPLMMIKEGKVAPPITLPCVYKTGLYDFEVLESPKVVRKVSCRMNNIPASPVKFTLFNERGEELSFNIDKKEFSEVVLFGGVAIGYKIESVSPNVKILSVSIEVG